MSKWCTVCEKDNHDTSECWGSGTQAVPPVKWKLSGIGLPQEPPGFHKLTIPTRCRHPEHNFPTHLHVPGGMRYVHYCPACKHKSAVDGIETSC
jgi:hypothetical protein